MPNQTRSAADPTFDRIDRDTEGALLAAILQDPSRALEMRGTPAEIFYDEIHRSVWEAIQSIINRGSWPEIKTLLIALEDKPLPQDQDWPSLIDRLLTAESWYPNWADYLARLRILAKERAQLEIQGNAFLAGGGLKKPYALAEELLELERIWAEDGIVPLWAEELLEMSLEQEEAVLGEGLLPYGGKLLMAGSPKLGKSILALQLALSLAAGVPWLGVFPVKREWRVLYVDFESTPSIAQERLRTMWEHFEVPLQSFALHTAPPLDLLEGDGARIRRWAEMCQAEIVILDTLSRLHSENENDNSAMNKVTAQLDRLIYEMGLAGLILNHHDRKQMQGFRKGTSLDEIRGASALTAWPESLVRIVPHEGADRRLLLFLRDQQNLSEVVTSYDPETMLSEGQVVTEREVASDKVLAVLIAHGGRMLRKELLATLTAGGIAGRTANRAISGLVKAGRVESVKSIVEGAHPRSKDIVVTEGSDEIAF